jgi:hypothetical protein
MKSKIQSSMIFPSRQNGVILNSWLNGLIFPSGQNIVSEQMVVVVLSSATPTEIQKKEILGYCY